MKQRSQVADRARIPNTVDERRPEDHDRKRAGMLQDQVFRRELAPAVFALGSAAVRLSEQAAIVARAHDGDAAHIDEAFGRRSHVGAGAKQLPGALDVGPQVIGASLRGQQAGQVQHVVRTLQSDAIRGAIVKASADPLKIRVRGETRG